MDSKKRHLKTQLVSEGIGEDKYHGSINPPIYKTSTVLYPDLETMQLSQQDVLRIDKRNYGRFGTPSVRNFEEIISKLEKGYKSVCTSSGLSAITTTLLAFLKSGDHLLVTDVVYGPTRNFCNSLSRYGIEVTYFSPSEATNIEKHIQINTKVVYIESPGSQTFEITDIRTVTDTCRKRNITTVSDNTWATLVFSNPITFGVDVVIHSATKYIIGHSDGILGVIVCADVNSYESVRKQAILLGQNAGEESVHLALRGLRTLAVRMEKHEAQAMEIALWLHLRPEVTRILYPALPDSPDHSLWKAQFSGSAALFTIILQAEYESEDIAAMLNGMEVFGLGFGWGGFESLISPISFSLKGRTEQMLETGQSLRLHIGLEDLEDLKRDLSEAFDRLKTRKLTVK